ncbi:hypothetical protein OSA68_03555 [Treponema pallidum]|nr:major outer sheath N-terminal domain-containing protein [Treponema pallidum]ADD72717.1 TPR protein H [Treponema pallidum subsp. pallidum str. Chicago]QUK44324.2 hypothetical protein KEA11_03035 [Treponema pallidum]QUK67351.2 hypothetical protein KEB12_03045 [Treponema pallidum]QUK71037.2 hypothetical protein KD952_03050 [Treponema pallidum]UWU98198.1 hypothetical protein N3P11_03105 [Treponema pallidum]
MSSAAGLCAETRLHTLASTPRISGFARLQWGITLPYDPAVGPPPPVPPRENGDGDDRDVVNVQIQGNGAQGQEVEESEKEKARIRQITHGFRSTTHLCVTVPLFLKSDRIRRAGTLSDGGLWTEISIKDLEVNFQTKKPGEPFTLVTEETAIEATLHCFGAYMTIGTAPLFRANFAQLWKPFLADLYKEEEVRFAPGFDGIGGRLGYRAQNVGSSGVSLDICFLSFASNGSWDAPAPAPAPPGGAAEEALHSKYGFGADATLSYAPWKRELVRAEVAASATLGKGYKRVSHKQKRHYRQNDVLWNAGARITLTPLSDFKVVLALDMGNHYAGRKTLDYLAPILIDMEKTKVTPGGPVAYAIAQRVLQLPEYAQKLDSVKNGMSANGSSVRDIATKIVQAEQTNPTVSSNPLLAALLTVLWQQALDTYALDALLTLQWRWFACGVYVATAPASVFGAMVFPTYGSTHTDGGGFLRVETKAGDAYTHLIDGLEAGMDVRCYIPLTHGLYIDNGKGYYVSPMGVWKLPDTHINLPVMGKVWARYLIPLGETAWLKPSLAVYGTTNRFNYNLKTENLVHERCVQYQVGLTLSPIEKVTLHAQWEQGQLEPTPYMVITETVTSRRYFGTFVCGMTINW